MNEPIGQVDPPGAGGPDRPPQKPAPARPENAPPARRSWPAIAVAAVIVVAVAAASAFTAFELLRHPSCALGAEVGTYNVTAPTVLLNAPGAGNLTAALDASAWTFSSGSLVVDRLSSTPTTSSFQFRGSGPGILYSLSQPVFAVYSVKNVSSESPGGSPCTQPYVAELASPGYCGGWVGTIAIPNGSNDSAEPDVINESCGSVPPGLGILSGGYMSFNTTFPPPGSGSSPPTALDLCNGSSNYTQLVHGAVGVSIRLTVPVPGGWVSAAGTLWWASWQGASPTAAYAVPPGALWEVASIGQYSEASSGLLPPGLLAFEEDSCT